MDKKMGVFDYLSQTFSAYGVTVLILNIFCIIFGEDAKEISTIFSLGKDGLCVFAALQFLLAIALITAMKFLFLGDNVIKRLSTNLRIILMFTSVLALIIVFILMFGWLDPNDLNAWLMFIASFVVSCSVSTFISDLKEKQENKKLNDALKKIKEEL